MALKESSRWLVTSFKDKENGAQNDCVVSPTLGPVFCALIPCISKLQGLCSGSDGPQTHRGSTCCGVCARSPSARRLIHGQVPLTAASHPAGVCRALRKLCSSVVVSAIGGESDQSGSTGEWGVECSAVPRGREEAGVAEMLAKEQSGGRSLHRIRTQFKDSRKGSIPTAGERTRAGHPHACFPAATPSPGGDLHLDLPGNLRAVPPEHAPPCRS